MTQHTLKYIHKKQCFCKAEPNTPAPKPSISTDIVNQYIKENPEIVSNYLRNERALKAQRKQMNARSSLNNACFKKYCILLYIIKNAV